MAPEAPPQAAPAPIAQVRWQSLPAGASPASAAPKFVPVPQPAKPSQASPPVWTPLPHTTTPNAAPQWRPVGASTPGPAAPQGPGQPGPPTSAAEAEERRQSLAPPPGSYPPLLRLGQLPTATFLDDSEGQVSFQQVSPGSGGVAGGTGNQNYGARLDLAVNSSLFVSAFYSYADDPLFAPITVRTSQPANLWTAGGVGLRARLAGDKVWTVAAEGSIELFAVGSGGGFGNNSSGNSSDNIFNTSGQQVYNRNVVGSLALPLRWNPLPRWQLALTPGVSFLPATQAGGTFYGTNVTVGVGSSYRIGEQLNLFSSATLPLGPGTNAFDGQLRFFQVPIWSAGAHYAVNPRIGLEASVTNGYGLTPATAILALPSAPYEPLLNARFVWTPGAVDAPRVRFSARQRSLTLGGLSVSTALLPPDGTSQLTINGDSLGNLLGSAAYSVSNDFAFEVSGGTYGNAGATATGASGSAASFLNTYLGPGNRNTRFGGKAMVFRPTKGLPLWAAGRITVGRNFVASSYQGYLFFETVNTWEATPWLAFNLNPKLAWSGFGTPWGVGLSANIQLGRSFQLIPEINAVATNSGGPNGTNGTLALRWLATETAAVDLYASNASGLLDMGQLLGTDQIRIGGKLTVQF